ncbi:MAG: hypothetical protein OQL28_14960 [Sedimenticola sp.]|nr:hypothetical protein [Sedimenticola sp.]
MPRYRFTRLSLTLLLTLILALVLSGSLDRAGYEQTEAGFKRALLVFAVSRGLNGVISVAQGTEVAVEPAGIGVNFKPGEILDPVNDLVERFSWVMLASSAFFGIQQVLLDVMASRLFTLLTMAAAGVLLWTVLRPTRRLGTGRRNLCRLALLLLILRLSVSLIAIGGEQLYQGFLEPRFTESRQQLEQVASHIGEVNEELQPPSETSSGSLLEGAKRVYESAARAMDVEARMAAFRQAAADISEHVINMIVVFMVQTLLFPLFSLWLLLQLVKQVLRARLGWLEQQVAGH